MQLTLRADGHFRHGLVHPPSCLHARLWTITENHPASQPGSRSRSRVLVINWTLTLAEEHGSLLIYLTTLLDPFYRFGSRYSPGGRLIR